MQLAGMVHGNGREEVHQTHHHHNPHPHQPSSMYSHHQHQQTRAHQPHSDAASTLSSNPYSSQQPLEYPYQRPPQSPPSPPVEDLNKPSLPSISSLLRMSNGAKNEPETAQPAAHSQHTHQPAPPPPPPPQQQQPHHASIPSRPVIKESRSQHGSQSYASSAIGSYRMNLPPTPPMQAESSIDGNQSPSAASSHSSIAAQNYYLGQSLNNMDPDQQRQQVPASSLLKRDQAPGPPHMSPYSTSSYTSSPYGASPGAVSTTSYYSPEHHPAPMYPPPTSNLYSQRPLPSNFPPPVSHIQGPSVQTQYQHHHYISASSAATFPQPQDRYICQTCNKAFSRPSSLRIHSHSHTGEKPYKCPQPGCGKAFSVRSNMKRHERGCHASGGAISA